MLIAVVVSAVLCADPGARLRGTAHTGSPVADGQLKPEIDKISASTVLPDWKGYNFSARNLIDGSPVTSWQPVRSNTGGPGEWVEINLKRECTIDRLEIANGFQRQDELGDLFPKNNRIHEARLVFSDGSAQLIELEANDSGFVKFDLKKTTRSVRLEVQSIHKGTEWNDLAISELELHGSCPLPAPQAAQKVRPLPTELPDLGYRQWAYAFSGDGGTLYVADQDCSLTAVSVAAPTQAEALIPARRDGECRGPYVVAGNTAVAVWTYKGPVTVVMGGASRRFEAEVLSNAAFSPDDRSFAAELSNGTVRVWSVADGGVVSEKRLEGSGSYLAYDGSGERLVRFTQGGERTKDRVDILDAKTLSGRRLEGRWRSVQVIGDHLWTLARASNEESQAGLVEYAISSGKLLSKKNLPFGISRLWLAADGRRGVLSDAKSFYSVADGKLEPAGAGWGGIAAMTSDASLYVSTSWSTGSSARCEVHKLGDTTPLYNCARPVMVPIDWTLLAGRYSGRSKDGSNATLELRPQATLLEGTVSFGAWQSSFTASRFSVASGALLIETRPDTFPSGTTYLSLKLEVGLSGRNVRVEAGASMAGDLRRVDGAKNP